MIVCANAVAVLFSGYYSMKYTHFGFVWINQIDICVQNEQTAYFAICVDIFKCTDSVCIIHFNGIKNMRESRWNLIKIFISLAVWVVKFVFAQFVNVQYVGKSWLTYPKHTKWMIEWVQIFARFLGNESIALSCSWWWQGCSESYFRAL